MRSSLRAYRLTLLSWLVGFFIFTAQAQTNNVKPPVVKFGQVTPADFTKQPVPVDTSAEAVVLYESANTRFIIRNNNVVRVADYITRTRINKKSAYDRATVEIRLYGRSSSDRDYVSGIEGYTYTLQNGQVVKQKMDKAAIISERVSDNLTIQKLTLPGVQEGCIIEYKYTHNSPGTETPPQWTFQQSVPVIWSDYKATLSNYFYYKVIMRGYLPLAIYESKPVASSLMPGVNDEGAVESHYAVANAPAFRNEPYITTTADYVSRIEFELSSVNIPGVAEKSYSLNWADLDKTLLEMPSFGQQYLKATYLRDVATAIKAKYPATDTLARVTAAYEYVRNTMTWNEQGNVQSDRLKKVLELKKGDAADLNFMLIGLLRDLGLDANPVILSTRDHGMVDQNYALLRNYNYVVGHLTIGGKDLLLDATDRFIKPGMLPKRALNQMGRLILPNGQSRFVSLRPNERDGEAKIATFTLSDEGELTGTLTHSYAGYGAVGVRESLKELGNEKFVDDVKRKKPSWQIEKADVKLPTDLNQPVAVEYKLTIPEGAQVAGDRIYLRPMFTEGETENPFKQPERQFPVDFGYPFDETVTAVYTLPKGYVAEELPKPQVMSLPDNGGRFTYQISQTDNQLTLTSRISIRKAVFLADEYPLLREFYEKVMLKHGEQIVLKKGTPAPVAVKK